MTKRNLGQDILRLLGFQVFRKELSDEGMTKGSWKGRKMVSMS